MRHHVVRDLVLAATLCLPVAAFGAQGDCGQPQTSGTTPKSSDALAVLKAAVKISNCAECICDTNSSGSTTSADALLTLKKAVSQPVTLVCPDCLATETIGAAGGTFTSHNGRVVITVPPGAVDAPTEFTIIGVAPPALPDEFDELDVNDAYDLGPDGATFDPPLQVTYHPPADTFAAQQVGVRFDYPLLVTSNESELEALVGLSASYDAESGDAEISGALAHFSKLVSATKSGLKITWTVEDFPSEWDVADGEFTSRMTLTSEAIELQTPFMSDYCPISTKVASEGCDECELKPATIAPNTFTKDGQTWVSPPLKGHCDGAGTCRTRFQATTPNFAGIADDMTFTLYIETTCSGQANNVIPVPRNDPEEPWAFLGPFGSMEDTAERVAIGTAAGSSAVNLVTGEVDLDLSVANENGHYGAFPLRHCNGTCKEAWMQYGPATAGISIWNYDPETQSFGTPDKTGGAFNGYDDAYPVGAAADGVADTVYAANIASARIEKIGYDIVDGKFELLGPIVTNGFGPSQNPSSLFPFPNGSMVIAGTGNGSSIPGKLYFHPGNNPATSVSFLGDVGMSPRRVRCAMCNGSPTYTCVISALFGSEMYVAKVDPATGTGSVTDHQPTGQGPNGVAVLPKLSSPGCFGIVTNFGGGGYMLCDIDNDGEASCESMSLPEECDGFTFARFVAPRLDGSLVFSCEDAQVLLQVFRPTE